MKNLYAQGSNQYQMKRRGAPMWSLTRCNWKDLTIVFGSIAIAAIIGVNFQIEKAWEAVPHIEFVGKVQAKEVQLAPLPEREANQALIRKLWGKDANVGLAIARCEGGYRTEAKNVNENGTIDEGIFQINSVHGMPDMMNATANILYAYRMYQEQNTNPWRSSQKCWGSEVN